MKRVLEEDRLTLHDLIGVSLRVDFFCTTDLEHVVASTFWASVDVRVDSITYNEQISELDFYYNTHQLFINDQIIVGNVLDFRCTTDEQGSLLSYCKMIICWD